MTFPDSYDWFDNPFDGPVDVNLSRDGDEWISHVFERLYAAGLAGGHRSSTHKPIFFQYRPTNGTLESTLLVTRSPDGRANCTITGSGERRDQDVDPWVDAINCAIAKIGKSLLEFPWWAVIGENPDASISPAILLAGPATIGGIELRPSAVPFTEIRGGYGLYSLRPRQTFLVQAHGVDYAYSQEEAMRLAAQRLKLLCSMLSLMSDRTWVLRDSPSYRSQVIGGHDHQVEFQLREPVWEAPPLPEFAHGLPEDMKQLEPGRAPMEYVPPSWLDDVWQTLSAHKWLSDLVNAYHEGLLLAAGGHDSSSLLTAVAIVEAVGNKGIKKLPRCSGCRTESCIGCRMVTGAGERFRGALGKVMDPALAASLGKLTYNQRSITAHQAALHGSEGYLGTYVLPRFISNDPSADFQVTTRRIRQAAARLLLLELGLLMDERGVVSLVASSAQ